MFHLPLLHCTGDWFLIKKQWCLRSSRLHHALMEICHWSMRTTKSKQRLPNNCFRWEALMPYDNCHGRSCRAKAGETAFLDLYQKLYEAPDPAPCLLHSFVGSCAWANLLCHSLSMLLWNIGHIGSQIFRPIFCLFKHYDSINLKIPSLAPCACPMKDLTWRWGKLCQMSCRTCETMLINTERVTYVYRG